MTPRRPERPLSRSWVSIADAARETGIPATTLRWHCRHENGFFHGKARFDRPDMPANMRAYQIPRSLLTKFLDERRQPS